MTDIYYYNTKNNVNLRCKKLRVDSLIVDNDASIPGGGEGGTKFSYLKPTAIEFDKVGSQTSTIDYSGLKVETGTATYSQVKPHYVEFHNGGTSVEIRNDSITSDGETIFTYSDIPLIRDEIASQKQTLTNHGDLIATHELHLNEHEGQLADHEERIEGLEANSGGDDLPYFIDPVGDGKIDFNREGAPPNSTKIEYNEISTLDIKASEFVTVGGGQESSKISIGYGDISLPGQLAVGTINTEDPNSSAVVTLTPGNGDGGMINMTYRDYHSQMTPYNITYGRNNDESVIEFNEVFETNNYIKGLKSNDDYDTPQKLISKIESSGGGETKKVHRHSSIYESRTSTTGDIYCIQGMYLNYINRNNVIFDYMKELELSNEVFNDNLTIYFNVSDYPTMDNRQTASKSFLKEYGYLPYRFKVKKPDVAREVHVELELINLRARRYTGSTAHEERNVFGYLVQSRNIINDVTKDYYEIEFYIVIPNTINERLNYQKLYQTTPSQVLGDDHYLDDKTVESTQHRYTISFTIKAEFINEDIRVVENKYLVTG